MNKPESWEDELGNRLQKQIEIWEKPEQFESLFNDLKTLFHSLLEQQRENCAKEYYLTVQNDSTIIQTEKNILNAPEPTTEKK